MFSINGSIRRNVRTTLVSSSLFRRSSTGRPEAIA